MDYRAMRGDVLTDLMLYCRAKPLQRPRRSQSGGVYQPLDNQRDMISCLGTYPNAITVPMIIDVTCYYQIRTKLSHVVNYDIDNVLKAILDNLIRAGLIADDKLVVGSTIFKTPSNEDRVHVRIYKSHFETEGLSAKSS